MSNATEYRVVWVREGLKPKRKRYATRKAAERFIALMGDDPWTALGIKDPDAPFCCAGGRECGCNGETYREQSDARRANMPKLLSVRMDEREVGPWREAPASGASA